MASACSRVICASNDVAQADKMKIERINFFILLKLKYAAKVEKILFAILIFLSSTSFSQNRPIARGAKSGELYLNAQWYGIYNSWGPPYYDTLQCAIYHTYTQLWASFDYEKNWVFKKK